MLAAALALITSLCYGVSNFVGPTISRGLPVYPVLIAGQLVAFAVSGAALAVTQPAGRTARSCSPPRSPASATRSG